VAARTRDSIVFVLVGLFALKAAVLRGPNQAKGLDVIFRAVASSAGHSNHDP
jgi:hypothetical protein